MSASGTYLFQSPQSEQIITDAYERIGVVPDLITFREIQTAQRSINFILISWINKGLNLFTVEEAMLGLNPGQNTYNLPANTSDVLEVNLRTSNRNLGGTAFSSAGGVANNAFDSNANAACIQTAPDGYISYSWGANQYATGLVGITSNVTRNYTLVFEYSLDNTTWTQVGAPPVQSYPQGQIQWFVIAVPTNGVAFRVRETGGATLNINELYFNTAVNDTVMNRSSRAEYESYPNKNTTGRPSLFYVDRQILPIIKLWLSPSATYNCLFFTRIVMIEDVGSMQNTPQISPRFLEAITAALACKLAVKAGQLDKVQLLKSFADEEYQIAAMEDRERVPLRIYGNYMQGWTQS